MDNMNRERITPDYSTLFVNTRVQEISILARAIRTESRGALTHREAIDRARIALVLADALKAVRA